MDGRDVTRHARARLEDVARLSGVSAKTVSRVFSDSSKVSPQTQQKVMEAAKRLRFRPNVLARDLRRGGVSNTIAFIIGDIQNPFYFHVAAGIERELSQHGFTMLLATTADSADSEARVVDSLLAQRVRALLLIPVADDQSYLEGERQLGTPIIGVDRPPRDLVADTVVLANRSGMAEAVRSLTALGHRRIGFVSNPSAFHTMDERLEGYREALREVGVTETQCWERVYDDPSVDVQESVRSLLDSPDPPTAIVTGNNRATAGALHELQRRRESIALIGFDDFDLADVLGISVVAYDTFELGRAAARLALDRIEYPDGPTQRIEVPTRLVHRGSGEIPVQA
ncbi:LacI family transcriptional regulator [Humibacter sp. BT305]|nr:LacI family transcriptional regulator [Humibacter sp. BT305]